LGFWGPWEKTRPVRDPWGDDQTCPGPTWTIMQHFTPIGVTFVADTGQIQTEKELQQI